MKALLMWYWILILSKFASIKLLTMSRQFPKIQERPTECHPHQTSSPKAYHMKFPDIRRQSVHTGG